MGPAIKGGFDAVAVGRLAEQVEALFNAPMDIPPQVIAEAAPEQLRSLTPSQLAGLSAQQCALFTVDQVRTFTSAQAQAFSAEDLAAMPDAVRKAVEKIR